MSIATSATVLQAILSVHPFPAPMERHVLCQTELHESTSIPCSNKDTCNYLVNGYWSDCASGTTGNECETDLDQCTSNPCLNSRYVPRLPASKVSICWKNTSSHY